ncbi:MAG TPA: aldehyde dehydrogenase [Nitrospirota bacterium]|nr:aldehyde dehydrogenase [Nitrospirota bacterium]
MDKKHISRLINKQREFFSAGKARDPAFRIGQLNALRKTVVDNEQKIFDALQRDLGKPAFESHGGETGIVIHEIDYALRHLKTWVKPKRVSLPLAYFPSKSYIIPEPYGVALIMGPWNFPFQLMLAPLVGAIASGNCALLKPSLAAPECSRLMTEIITECFDPAYISLIEGGAETAQMLLEERFDYIFFTGGSAAGRIVMTAAAKNLTPVTLELGGKNPCIVDADTHLEYTARRIVWGKFFSAGQSCVAVDYLLVDKQIKEQLVARIVQFTRDCYGPDPSSCPDYGRIVNETHFDHLSGLLGCGSLVMGGQMDRAMRYIAPTIIEGITGVEPIMQDEIFGPLLPIIEYKDLSRALEFVHNRPKPLALYFFSRNKQLQDRVLRETSSGGGCINDTVIHETSTRLPFGGEGASGIGKYHGKASFDTFTHERSIVKSSFLMDNPLRYPPYKNHLKWLKNFF